jgi:hypothetical protein
MSYLSSVGVVMIIVLFMARQQERAKVSFVGGPQNQQRQPSSSLSVISPMTTTVESLYADIKAFVIQLVVPLRGLVVVTIEKDLPHRDSDDLPMRS